MVSMQRLVGGLMTGMGQGMQLDGKAKREAALAELEHQQRLELADRQHGFNMDERGFTADRDDARTDKDNAADDRRSKDDQNWRSTEADKGRNFDREKMDKEHQNRLGEIGAQGEEHRKTDAAKGTDTEGLSAEDVRMLDVLEGNPSYQTKDPKNPMKSLPDYEKIGQRLIQIGRPDLAKLYGVSETSPEAPRDDRAPTAQQLPEDRAQLKVGTVYSTRRGAAKYLGNGQFETVN